MIIDPRSDSAVTPRSRTARRTAPQILGNITVGPGTRVAAGSMVLKAVPEQTTVAGIPARVVGGSGSDDPGKAMDQVLPDSCHASFTYVIRAEAAAG